MKKLTSILLALVMVLSLSVPAFADGGEYSAPGTGSTTINVEVASSYSVVIPQTVTLTKDEGTGSGEYSADITVTVTGDIDASKVIKVVPAESVTLSATGNDDVEATVTVGTTEFGRDAALGDGSTGTHTVTASLTPAVWSGTLEFAISLDDVPGYKLTITAASNFTDNDDYVMVNGEKIVFENGMNRVIENVSSVYMQYSGHPSVIINGNTNINNETYGHKSESGNIETYEFDLTNDTTIHYELYGSASGGS